MNERPCITHTMEHVRACVIRGYHLDYCDGMGPDGDECTGCLPRPALDQMLVCEMCFDKFTAAVGLVKDLMVHLRSIDRGSQSIDGVRSGALIQPSYPLSWQSADSLWQTLERMARAVNPEYWGPHYTGGVGFTFSATLPMVATAAQTAIDELHNPAAFLNRHDSATAAVTFYRAVQAVNRRYNLPLDDPKAVPVKYLHCRNCKARTLKWIPVIQRYDEVGIQCSNPACGTWYDPVTITFDMRLLAQQLSEAGHANEAAAAEIVKMLRVPPRDEAWPICTDCSTNADPTNLVGTRKPVDETCRLCGNPTDAGLYRRYVS